MTKTRDNIAGYYLSWVNDFLSVERFAEYHGLSTAEATDLIELGKVIHEGNVYMFKNELTPCDLN